MSTVAVDSPKNSAISKGFVRDAKVMFKDSDTTGKIVGYQGGKIESPIVRVELEDGSVVSKSITTLDLVPQKATKEVKKASAALKKIKRDTKKESMAKNEPVATVDSPKNSAISKGFVRDAKVMFKDSDTTGKIVGYQGGKIESPTVRVELEDGIVVSKSITTLDLVPQKATKEVKKASGALEKMKKETKKSSNLKKGSVASPSPVLPVLNQKKTKKKSGTPNCFQKASHSDPMDTIMEDDEHFLDEDEEFLEEDGEYKENSENVDEDEIIAMLGALKLSNTQKQRIIHALEDQ